MTVKLPCLRDGNVSVEFSTILNPPLNGLMSRELYTLARISSRDSRCTQLPPKYQMTIGPNLIQFAASSIKRHRSLGVAIIDQADAEL
jgi:hypothetical protein